MKMGSVRSLCVLSAIGILLSGLPVQAADSGVIRTADVTLNGEGLLQGTVLTSDAQPIVGATVEIIHADKKVATAVSNEEGQFAVKGLRSGVHVIQCSNTQQPVRFWTTASAPPTAVRNVSLVVDNSVVRGQQGSGVGAFVPFAVIGGVIGVVLGTTLDDNGNPAPPASP